MLLELQSVKDQFEVQVSKDHYFENYDNLGRFISYYYQSSFAIDLNPSNVLEIGIGNKTVYNYLTQCNIKVDTLDFDKSLNPDFVNDVRDMSKIDDNSYDLVMACEILEHIPWDDIPKALNELSRTSKRYVLISVPHCAFVIQNVFVLPLLQSFVKEPFFKLSLSIPLFLYKPKFGNETKFYHEEHYWEIGMRGYSLRKIKRELRKNFNIIKTHRPVMNPYHHFFVLEKK